MGKHSKTSKSTGHKPRHPDRAATVKEELSDLQVDGMAMHDKDTLHGDGREQHDQASLSAETLPLSGSSADMTSAASAASLNLSGGGGCSEAAIDQSDESVAPGHHGNMVSASSAADGALAQLQALGVSTTLIMNLVQTLVSSQMLPAVVAAAHAGIPPSTMLQASDTPGTLMSQRPAAPSDTSDADQAPAPSGAVAQAAPSDMTVAALVAKPSPEPEAALVAKPVPEPKAVLAAKPASEPGAAMVAEPVSEPGAAAVAEPAAELEATLVAKPAFEPEAELVAKPASEPEAVLSAKPVSEPEAALVAKPATELEAALAVAALPAGDMVAGSGMQSEAMASDNITTVFKRLLAAPRCARMLSSMSLGSTDSLLEAMLAEGVLSATGASDAAAAGLPEESRSAGLAKSACEPEAALAAKPVSGPDAFSAANLVSEPQAALVAKPASEPEATLAAKPASEPEAALVAKPAPMPQAMLPESKPVTQEAESADGKPHGKKKPRGTKRPRTSDSEDLS